MANNNDKKVLNVPALRFPEFSGEWRYSSLWNECDILCGYPFDGQDILEDSGSVKLLRGINITEGEIRHSKELDRYYSGDISRLEKYILKEGDLVLGMDGSKVGRNSAILTISEHGSYLVQRVCRIRSQKHNVEYIFHNINNSKFHRYVDSVKTASAIPHISQSDIQDYIIAFPPTTEEQIKITSLFSLLDQRIATQNKIIKKYESLIQAMCDTLIESEQHKVELSFNDFGEPYSGLSGKSAEDFGNGCPYITYMNVYQNQIIDITDVGLVKINETEQQSVVRYGDILFTLSSETANEVGMGAVYLGDAYPLYLNSFCFGVHITDESKIFSPFLAYYISTQSFRKAVFPLAQGSTRFNLQKSDFMKKIFLFPTVEKQNKIYSVLKTYSNKLSIEKNIVNLLYEQKSYLLRQLFI